ncbi:Putative Transposase YhgA family protein [Mycoavidus cysteinexigens]|uniref:Transposase YhgA family protein n=1 Tax=Mycoavidus cysteinexigens TaxID=1553431 RepID=A0A2Z6EU48_9BURK|nr:Putative Transposase YhgA family protein [Mycoavidus cysteinexigens]GAM52307.1 hypothetical protein EBME_0770 [bacterium endosymbiont of Mortierella elongata FMR23-6]GLR01186.1 hypothetical protein GCM10007934_09980 [Mycoavidus cysteinexigens]
MFALIKPVQLIALSALSDDILLIHKRYALLELAQNTFSWDLTHLAPKVFELFERYSLDIEKRKFLLYYLAK